MPESKTALDWLKSLPLVGQEVQVLLKNNGIKNLPWCRISKDETHFHFGTIRKLEKSSFLIITNTEEIPISEVVMVSFFDGVKLRFLIREKAPD